MCVILSLGFMLSLGFVMLSVNEASRRADRDPSLALRMTSGRWLT